MNYRRFCRKVFYYFAERSKNQGEKYKSSLGTFVKGSYKKRKACRINMRTQDQMAVGILNQKTRDSTRTSLIR